MVEALEGFPGIHSARYAGPRARPLENNAKLLKMMKLRGTTNRKAHFHCCLLLINPKNEEFIFHGKLHGEIAKNLSGENGFGYDPLFIPQGENRSLAEMGLDEKNAISHRGKALKKLCEMFKENTCDMG